MDCGVLLALSTRNQAVMPPNKWRQADGHTAASRRSGRSCARRYNAQSSKCSGNSKIPSKEHNNLLIWYNEISTSVKQLGNGSFQNPSLR